MDEFSRAASKNGFVDLRQFAPQHQGPIPEHVLNVAERLDDSVRRLVDHDRPRGVGQLPQQTTAFAGTMRQEALEDEAIGRETGDRKQCRDGGRPGYRRDLVAGSRGGAHQQGSRIGETRRSRVRHQGDRGAVRELLQQRVQSCSLVEFVA